VSAGRTTAWLESPDRKAIDVAAANLRGVLLKTPLLENERLNEKLGGRVLIKAECLQRTGSFKARGAWNWLSSLGDPKNIAGVMALSSGNHGQAVAWAARRLGIEPVVILVPENAPRAKHERIRAWGADIVTYDRRTVDREALIATWVAGGGLSGGCAVALANTDVDLWAVEPEGYDDMGRSLAAGERLPVRSMPETICDALLSPIPGELGFAVNHAHGTRAVVASDAAVRRAMAYLADYFGLIVEPGGAIALAALLENRPPLNGGTAIVVASGANVDTSLLLEVLTQP